ncbi:hypothetical protein VUN84_03175 [Micrococcaceae bacterium Sec5.8]
MTSPLEWATLAVCCAALLLRLPDAVRGRNRTVFGILLLATLCSLLAVSELYAVVDGALGGKDVTSLILRYTVFATVLLVGSRLTRGLGAAREHSLITGGLGWWALGLSCLAVTVTFFLVYGPRAGVQDWSSGGAGNPALASLYAAAGRTYPAYVSLVLIPPLLAAFRGRLPRLVRAGALTVLLGVCFAVLSLPASLGPAAWSAAQDFLNYGAVLGYVVGLALFWFSGLVTKSSNTQATFGDRQR